MQEIYLNNLEFAIKKVIDFYNRSLGMTQIDCCDLKGKYPKNSTQNTAQHPNLADLVIQENLMPLISLKQKYPHLSLNPFSGNSLY